jgi:hypothetical protein
VTVGADAELGRSEFFDVTRYTSAVAWKDRLGGVGPSYMALIAFNLTVSLRVMIELPAALWLIQDPGRFSRSLALFKDCAGQSGCREEENDDAFLKDDHIRGRLRHPILIPMPSRNFVGFSPPISAKT